MQAVHERVQSSPAESAEAEAEAEQGEEGKGRLEKLLLACALVRVSETTRLTASWEKMVGLDWTRDF